MKVGTLKFVFVAAVTGLLLVAGSTAAWAQSPNYSDFTTNGNLINFNGNATINGGALQLTTNASNQVGSAWFNVQQPVNNGFTTTFTFQITNPSSTPADGIAFVIQNASTGVHAIGFTGGNGGALGYGDNDGSTNNHTGEGIANSIAIEFDTYNNSPWDQGSSNHVAIQSCGTGNNTSHHNQVCVDGTTLNSTLDFEPLDSPTFADGQPHTVTITYVPPSPSAPSGLGTLSVNLGETQVASALVDLSHLLNLTAGDAYVGFTSATGGSFSTQDILSWTYQAQTQPQQTTVYNFPNNNYVVTPAANQPTTTVQVTPIFVTPAVCDTLVQANPMFLAPTHVPPLTTQCFVYVNPDGSGVDKSVLYEVTCPSLPSGECSPFFADLGTTYDVSLTDNPNFHASNPFPGWLKGHGTDQNHPCTNNNPPLFVSNQISFFDFSVNDPFTKGKSGGTGSCWVATFNTPHEDPTVVITTPANGGVYQQGAIVNANYTCLAVNSSGATGPYLTPTQCVGPVASGSPIDTTLGNHTFTVNTTDSATDNASATSSYTVVAPADLAILNLAAPRAPVNSTLTYSIGVGDLGGATAVGVTVTDTLPAGLTALSGAGNNISCAIVNRRLTCTTVSFTCTVAGSTVTCPVGPIAPLSWSALNGATLQIKAKVTAAVGTVLKDTATVSSSNADSKPSNNSSTATTTVTAH